MGYNTDIFEKFPEPFSFLWRRNVEDEEIEEIQKEEMEMIEILEQEMRDVERSLEDDFEEQLLIAISSLSIKSKMKSGDMPVHYGVQ